MLIDRAAEGGEYELGGAFDDGLAFAIEREGRVMALIGSELFGGCDDDHVFAASDKDGAFAGGDEDEAVFAVIDIDVGGDVKDEELAVFAFVYVELLLFD